ncbi:MAG: DUF4391 domain-containing protein [Eggerthellaceae bacterium]|nr:DUF4391 domain-containing protein [Eggerthellaceae bacterium]
MYGLPSTTRVDQVLPKKAFYEHLKLSSAVKDEFVHAIEELRVVASIKERSCGIAATDAVQEIMVLRVVLRQEDVPVAALDAIAANNPNKLVFACAGDERVRFAVRRGAFRLGPWQPEGEALLALQGQTLSEVWDSLCAQVLFGDADGASVDARLEQARRIKELEAQVVQLKRRHAKEVQPAKRNAAFKRLRAAQAELAALKGA